MAEKTILNAASLLDLKAELLRKQEALKEAKLKRGLYSEFSGTKLKRVENESRKKKKVKEDKVPELSQQEAQALEKSRSMLERKAALYEKLSSGLIVPDEEQSELFLVNFVKKASEKPQGGSHASAAANSPEPEIKDIPLPSNSTLKTESVSSSKSQPIEQVIAEEKHLDETDDNSGSGAVHYQNVQFKEVRNHGVGYYSFSMDEEERKKQMEALNALRQQTEDQQKYLLKKKRKQQALLKARLAKVRIRKNIPAKESEEEDSIEEQESEEDPDRETDFSVIEQPEPSQAGNVEDPKPVRVRPWDKGKDFSDLLPERQKSHNNSATQWMENRRAERVSDFGPPQSYDSSSKRSYQNRTFWTQPKQQSSAESVDDEAEVARIIGEKISAIKNQF